MMRRRVSWLAAILSGVLGLSAIVRAQPSTATLQGTVVDESSAVVPGVPIALVNLETGLQRSAQSGADGTFIVSLLPPGRYRLTARHDGFVPTEIPAIVLNVGDAVGMKVLLKVAGVEASVSVIAGAPRVSTSPSVSTVVDRQFVENIPLNGRSFQPLISLTPGVVVTPATLNSPGQFSVNGQRSDANYFTVDGVSANVSVYTGVNLGVSGAGAAPGMSAQGGASAFPERVALRVASSSTATLLTGANVSATRHARIRREKLSITACKYVRVPSSRRMTVVSMCHISSAPLVRSPRRATHAPSSAGHRDPWRWSGPRCAGRHPGADGHSVAAHETASSCGRSSATR